MQVTWIVRWVHLLRAVRLGYNFFNIDTDVVLHDDIYKVRWPMSTRNVAENKVHMKCLDWSSPSCMRQQRCRGRPLLPGADEPFTRAIVGHSDLVICSW